jgi:membrane-associated phospholipid phosphatase
MNRRQLLWAFLIAIVLTLLSIFFLDQPIAAFVQRVGGRQSVVLQQGTHWLEIATGLPIARYFVTYVLLGLATVLFIARSTRLAAWMLLFIGSTQLVTRLVGGALKDIFQRLRPFEVIQAGNWDWKFFSGHGNSFPSGHSAQFWGLFFPLLFLFPRYRFPLLIVPVFISIARVGVNDHWCSDVIASAGLAALFTLIFIWLFRMQPAPQSAKTNVARQ